MIDDATSKMLARHWEEGNNACDVEMVVEPFAKNVVLNSPFVSRLSGDPAKTTIEGRDAVREYIANSFRQVPDIRYTLDNTYVGTDSIILLYTCHLPDGRTANGSDFMRVDSEGKVVEWRCHYPFSPADMEHLVKE